MFVLILRLESFKVLSDLNTLCGPGRHALQMTKHDLQELQSEDHARFLGLNQASEEEQMSENTKL